MIGKTNRRFWKHFEALPRPVQKLAREKYALWRTDPHHPSLKFEERRNGICVVRIGDHYRTLGLREGEVVAWFWIGTHEEYNRFRFYRLTRTPFMRSASRSSVKRGHGGGLGFDVVG